MGRSRRIRTADPAVVAIDLHRGHLDPAIATMALAADLAERVVAANARFFRSCRRFDECDDSEKNPGVVQLVENCFAMAWNFSQD